MDYSRSTGGNMSIQIPLQLQEFVADVRPNKNDLDAFVLRSVNFMDSWTVHLHSIFQRLPKILFSRRSTVALTTVMIIDIFKKIAEGLFWIAFAFGLGIAIFFFTIYLIFFWMPLSDLEI